MKKKQSLPQTKAAKGANVGAADKKAQAKLKKAPSNKAENNNEPYQKTAYTEGMRRNHKPMKKEKMVPADKKVGKTKYG